MEAGNMTFKDKFAIRYIKTMVILSEEIIKPLNGEIFNGIFS